MPDLEVDLVDQFICPPCVDKHPELSLRTTWKRRCLYGLEHKNPQSADSCHKPARGAFSKYCSDECGVKYMRLRIELWADKGGDKNKLWESVKGAQKREGTVVSAKLAQEARADAPSDKYTIPGLVKPEKTRKDRELEGLHAKLDEVVKKRDAEKEEMDLVLWREKVTGLAIRRSDSIEECGWDQRLCFGDEEVAEFGTSVLESYESGQSDGDAMQVDAEGEWWCQGKKKCDRHVGWQKLRLAEVQFEKEMKEQALLKLTTRERKIRTRIEDILDPHARVSATCNSVHTTPQKATTLPSTNGQPKPKAPVHADSSKKGKKKR
ncbi:hypothetical protein DENSPDRAFT_770501 [Dentipellis sp. KUC8613]|nr:hypothetical protein DENSPDRAFT_770501 [Dentipellis sp. KUC8613]